MKYKINPWGIAALETCLKNGIEQGLVNGKDGGNQLLAILNETKEIIIEVK